MTDEFALVRNYFMAALEKEGLEAQLRYVAEQCDDAPELLAKLEEMIRAHHETEGFLASKTSDVQDPAAIHEEPGSQIGPYKLQQQIGEGGMGTVFMAEQVVPVRRTVALKLIKPGMDSRQVIARFEAERQALSMMDHPNIAKVLDAGKTDNGRPYFVMELVRGQRITTYCDEKRLTTRQRLELLLPICNAIQHAHQKGIIHRDIKPSNIMIAEYDDLPVPKIIDFGVAKAISQPLTEKTLFTGYGQLVGTLEYMSPEQAKVNELDIDTRSDIYSLGVLLYELLTGSTPFDRQRLRSAAWDEMLRIIREEEPPRPSVKLGSSATLPSIAANRSTETIKLTVSVRGELDWIVMKSLDKERGRRYQTANALAQDLQNYLNDQPVLACPLSSWYRLRKFARRKRLMLTASAALFLALFLAIAGIAGSIGWRMHEQQARIARTSSQIELALQEVDRLIEEGKVGASLAAINYAIMLSAGEDVDAYWRERTLQYSRDLKFVEQLEEARLLRGDSTDRGGFLNSVGDHRATFRLLRGDSMDGGGVEYRAWNAAYLAALSDYGLSKSDMDAIDSATLAAALPQRGYLATSVAACLDDWVVFQLTGPADANQRHKLLSTAQILDPHPVRVRLRQAMGNPDSKATIKQLETISDSTKDAIQEPATTMLLTNLLMSVGQVEQATDTLRSAQIQYPDDIWINFALAHALQHKHDRDSLRFFAAAVALKPSSVAVLTQAANAFTENKAYGDAMVVLQQALRLQPNNQVVHNQLGLLQLAQENSDAALSAFQQALAIDENYAAAQFNFGITLLRQGQGDEALQHFKKAIELEPEMEAPRYDIAHQLILQGELDEAVSLLRPVIENNPMSIGGIGSTLTWQDLGWCHYRLGNWNYSLDSLTKSLDLQEGTTGDAGRWIVMALAHQRLASEMPLFPQERASHVAEAGRFYRESTRSIDDLWMKRGVDKASDQVLSFCIEMEELIGLPSARELIEADTADLVKLRKRLAALFTRHNQLAQLVAFYQSILDDNSDDVRQQTLIKAERFAYFILIGDSYAIRSQWAEAAFAYQVGPAVTATMAPALLLAKQDKEYLEYISSRLDEIRQRSAPNAGFLYGVVYGVSLSPEIEIDRGEIIEMGEKSSVLDNELPLGALALAYHRDKQYQRVIELWGDDATTTLAGAEQSFLRAMAHHALGNLDEATHFLRKGLDNYREASPDGGPVLWPAQRWLQISVLKNEACQTILGTTVEEIDAEGRAHE